MPATIYILIEVDDHRRSSASEVSAHVMGAFLDLDDAIQARRDFMEEHELELEWDEDSSTYWDGDEGSYFLFIRETELM